MNRILMIALLTITLCDISWAESYSARIYKASATGNMVEWKATIDAMNANVKVTYKPGTEYLLNYQYGYIAWCLAQKRNEEALLYLEKAENILQAYIKLYGQNAITLAYTSAFIAYRIAMNPSKAVVEGYKCVKLVHDAVALNPKCVQAWIEYGNVYNYMPAVFGGSKEKALKAYQTALNLMNLERIPPESDWLYPFIEASIGKVYMESKQYSTALTTFEHILTYAPGYVWVQKTLLPEVKEQINK